METPKTLTVRGLLMGKEKQKHDGTPVPPELWGKDHVSTMVYIESVCVDGSGQPRSEKMRTWGGRPQKGKVRGFPSVEFEKEYPTRLSNGVELHDHDDWDCVNDMEAAGLIIWNGTGIQPIFELTPGGWMFAGMLRRHLAKMSLVGKRGYLGFDVADAVAYAKVAGNAIRDYEVSEIMSELPEVPA